jgi:hypothetical protein
MAQDRKPRVSHDEIEINLKDPVLAGFWAWLWPGAGHLYQGRYAKAALFMICILGTYFYGLALSGGHVVYFSWTETDKRLPFICQVGVGLPALPALVQSYRVIVKDKPYDSWWGGFMAPPHPVIPGGMDTKAKWCARYGFRWDMAELYTMVAGLLNILAIFDATAGPVLPPVEEEDKKDKPPPEEQDKPKAGGK